MTAEERAKTLFFEAADLFDAGRHAEAEALLRQVLTLVPERSSVLGNLAAAVFRQQRFDEALELAARATTLDENNTSALFILASAQIELGHITDALATFDRLIALTPDDPDAWIGRARAFCDLLRWPEAVAAYDHILRIAPDYGHIEGQRVFARLQMADWNGIEEEVAAIVSDVRRGLPVCAPFQFVAISDNAADQLACARLYVAAKLPATTPQWRGERYRHDRIRLAYVSGDLRNHALAFLTAGLFEQHDRSRFETIAVSVGEDDGSALRRTRLPAAFDRFIDMRERADGDIAVLIRELEVDIAIDLAGHTGASRAAAFAARPAPVQVNYLGYPATMGAPYYDYIIADRFVIPETDRACYAENPVYLPDTFQVNDDRRSLPPPPTRAQAGLPPSGFVFSCFNAPYKIRPDLFDVWMRLLAGTPGSVLWLVANSNTLADNLRHAAADRGVDPARLIFAARMAYDDHLARFQLADLFLDTLPYNGGATASDALWCGVPVVTCAGGAFAARMAGSLLHAIGLAELATGNLVDYEALALKLAHSADVMGNVKKRLALNRTARPLFDTKRFTRHVEAAYVEMWQRVQRGDGPSPIRLTDSGE